MITSAHTVIFSQDADADRKFFRDVLKFPHVDAGGGWLIFKQPPSELAIHPAESNNKHEFYLVCDDINAFIKEMEKHQISSEPVKDEGWGYLTSIKLPGGGDLGVYEPKHEQPV